MCGDNVIYSPYTHTLTTEKKISNKIALGMSWNFTEKHIHTAMSAMSIQFFFSLLK